MKGLLKLLLIAATSVSLFANDDILIEPEEAIKLIGKEGVMFVSGDSHDTYDLYHIKGSVEMYAHHLHHSNKMGEMHCSPLFMCIEEAEEYISSKGISNDTMVIAYDNFRGPNATGVYHYFKSWGHDNVKILNGGFDAIKSIDPEQTIYDAMKEEYKEGKDKLKEKYKAEEKGSKLYKEYKAQYNAYKDEWKAKLAKQEKKLLVQRGKGPKITPTDYKIDPDKIDTTYLAGKQEVKHAMEEIVEDGKEESDYVILDSRGMSEIIGERYLDNVARAGHIPGATFIEWKNITDFDNKRSFRSLDEMEEFFKSQGITKDKTIYAYCHVGAGRSSHLITALMLLGYPNVKVYTGSWDEWGNDMSLPIKR